MAIKLSDARYEEIKQSVVDMLMRCQINCVPISGFEIATKMGIAVVAYSSFALPQRALLLKKSEDGFSVLRADGRWFIYYNDAKDYGRINNTMMHEIGHIILDHTEDSELAEAEVKFFAKYALAPPILVHQLKLETPYAIMDAFGISYEAARYAFCYYQKWLRHGRCIYTNYELATLNLFENAV